MGLHLEKTMNTGVIVTHWEFAAYSVMLQIGKEWIQQRAENNMPLIDGVIPETVSDGIHVILNGYLNKETFNDGKMPLQSIEIILPIPQDMGLSADILPYLHQAILGISGWESAVYV